MSKAKTARLSLTLPSPLDANGESGPDTRATHDTTLGLGGKGTDAMDETRTSSDSTRRRGAGGPETDPLPAEPRSPTITSLPQLPTSPGPGRSPHSRDQSRSIFSNIKAAKSSAKIPGSEGGSRAGSASASTREGRPKHGETRKRSIAGLVTSATGTAASSQEDVRSPRQGSSEPSALDIQQREGLSGRAATYHASHISPSASLSRIPDADLYEQNAAKKGRGFGFMRRNASHQSEEFREDTLSTSESKPQSRGTSHPRAEPVSQPVSSFNPLAANDPQHLVSQKSGFLKALRTGANKTMLGMKKQRDKLTKSSSKPSISVVSTPRANPDYQYKILYAPLLDQVRATRIAPRLEMSRDKTEFWLPALPWRCIDYLNYRGVEEEGIYRHSGSLQHVNYYKQKFDREGDVNLYEETDLYDVNVIASLLKAWLRDLPEPIFPSHLQSKIVDNHTEETRAPEELKQTIAQLAPWQYYLLFAITCHLSLIAGAADKNKMRVDNLFTCIGSQALKLDAHLFTWLVDDWRNCWMGCSAEKAYLEQEYAYLDERDRDTATISSLHDDSQPPLSSSSRGYPDSAYGSFTNQHVSSPLARPNPPRPFGENDGRPGSSRSQGNLRPAPSYQVSQSNDATYDSAPSSANSSGPSSARATGSRKPSQTDMVRSTSDPRNQMQVQNHQPRAPSPLGRRNKQDTANSSRERSPLGRRVARAETGIEGADPELRAASRRRAQSQPRSDTSRGKSPAGQGRRRPRGETTSASPANRSPSQNSDQFPEKVPAGRRRREGSEAPEMPTLQKEQRQRFEQLTGAAGRDRNNSEPKVRPGPSVEESRKHEKRRDAADEPATRERGGRGMSPALALRNPNEVEETPASSTKHERKGSKFRLSEQKFPEPISPVWKG